MLESKHLREQRRIQALQLEARIKKMKTDEEKVKKRIKDTQRELDFVSNIK